jgi:phage terminase small subunit
MGIFMAKTKGAKGGGGRPSETSQLALRGGNEPPKKPDGLRGEFANRLWDLAIESLPHVLRKVDEPALEQCCIAYQRVKEMDAILAGDHLNKEAHNMMVSAMTKFDSLAKSLGLNPHSRRVIKPADGEQAEKKEDAFEQFLKRSGGLN